MNVNTRKIIVKWNKIQFLVLADWHKNKLAEKELLLSGIIKETPEITSFLNSYFYLDTFKPVQASF